MRSLLKGFSRWPTGQDALIDAVQCVILANWTPGQQIPDPDVAELYRVFRDLTGWEPTLEEKESAQPYAAASGEAITPPLPARPRR